MNASEPTSEPKDSVTLLREYAAIRIFHADTFARARTLMRNCADEIERLRVFHTALEQIRDGKIIQGMSPALFANRVLSRPDGYADNGGARP
jgi:hypothetical protein